MVEADEIYDLWKDGEIALPPVDARCIPAEFNSQEYYYYNPDRYDDNEDCEGEEDQKHAFYNFQNGWIHFEMPEEIKEIFMQDASAIIRDACGTFRIRLNDPGVVEVRSGGEYDVRDIEKMPGYVGKKVYKHGGKTYEVDVVLRGMLMNPRVLPYHKDLLLK